MPQGKITGNTSRLLRQQSLMKAYVEQAMREVVVEGADRCSQIAKKGFRQNPREARTGALAASFYVKGFGLNDYQAKVGDMLTLYTERYTAQHGQERIANPVMLAPNQIAYGSTSRVMAFWEYGHQNLLTGQFEKHPIMRPVREIMRGVAKAKVAAAIKRAAMDSR
jgi:hypothetical protein